MSKGHHVGLLAGGCSSLLGFISLLVVRGMFSQLGAPPRAGSSPSIPPRVRQWGGGHAQQFCAHQGKALLEYSHLFLYLSLDYSPGSLLLHPQLLVSVLHDVKKGSGRPGKH